MLGETPYNDHAGREAQGNEELGASGSATRMTQYARAPVQRTAQRDAGAREPLPAEELGTTAWA
jgi:hypothetical protein